MDNLSKEQSLYRFITSEGDFFTDDYLDESFAGKVYENSFLGKKNRISEDDFAASANASVSDVRSSAASDASSISSSPSSFSSAALWGNSVISRLASGMP